MSLLLISTARGALTPARARLDSLRRAPQPQALSLLRDPARARLLTLRSRAGAAGGFYAGPTGELDRRSWDVQGLSHMSLPHAPVPCIIRPRRDRRVDGRRLVRCVGGGTMSRGHSHRMKPHARGARVATALLALAGIFFVLDPASAQLFQWTPEQLIKYTAKNPYDRFPDGRPKVPDEMLERLKGLIAEEVQAVLPGRGFPNQFEPREGWKVLQPNQKMVGRVFTIQFMPARGDIIEVDEADAKAKGTSVARNQTAIDMLQPGDVIVADVFGAEWNFVGNKLAHYIQTTTKNGMIVDGGVYWLERIAETGMQAYYKNSLPTQNMRVMVTGINVPVRIGKTLVMPGDVVLADREGMWFIPPQAVKDVVESGELSKARDDWSLMMLGTGKYTSRQIYGPLTPELQKMRDGRSRRHARVRRARGPRRLARNVHRSSWQSESSADRRAQ